MAYKFSKGDRSLGDIKFEDDSDTGIDFEADTVKIETSGSERLVVSNTSIQSNEPIKIRAASTSGSPLDIEWHGMDGTPGGSESAINISHKRVTAATRTTSISFNKWYNNGSSDTSIVFGAMAATATGTWDNNASSRVGSINFKLVDPDNAGSLTERMRITTEGEVGIGTSNPNEMLSVGPDTDVSAEIGRAHIGYAGHANLATFCHVDQNSTTGYAMGQNSAGSVIFNVPTGQTYRWRVNNSDTGAIGIDTDLNMGIGTLSPRVPLHVKKGSDAALSTAYSGWVMIGDESGQNIIIDDNEIMARVTNGTTAGTLYLQAEGGGVKIGGGGGAPDDLFEVNGSAKITTALKTPLIEYTDGDNAITIEDGGYLKFHSGVKYSRGVRVSSGNSGDEDYWIKIASIGSVDNVDTSASSFLITISGQESSQSRKQDGLFLVHVRYTPNTGGSGGDPGNQGLWYEPEGCWVVVEPLHADKLSSNQTGDFDPTTDIFITFENDSSPQADIYIKSPAKNKEIFVTHLGGTGVSDQSATDPGFVIQSGQPWETSEPAGYAVKIKGTWASKVFSTLKTTGDIKAIGTLKAESGVYIKVRDVNSTSDILTTDYVLRCIQSSPITLTLPPKSGNAGQVVTIKDALGNASSNNITIDGDASDTVDGNSTFVISVDKQSITLVCDGINGWMITAVT